MVKVRIISSSAEIQRGAVNVRFGRWNDSEVCHWWRAVHLESAGNRISVDAICRSRDTVCINTVRNVLIEIYVNDRRVVFFYDNRLVLRIQNFKFPGSITGDISFERKTVFDSISVGADQFVVCGHIQDGRLDCKRA